MSGYETEAFEEGTGQVSYGDNNSSNEPDDGPPMDDLSAFGGSGADVEDLRSGFATTGPMGFDDDGDAYYQSRRGLDALANQYNQESPFPSYLGTLANTISQKNVEAMSRAIGRGGIPTFDSRGNVDYVTLPSGQIIGTAPTPMSSMFQSDNSDQTSLSQMGSQIAQAQQAATSGIPSGNNAYYSRGVGTATVDMSDPAQRQAYLANLTAPTASPIGATYDPIKKQYILPDGTKIDANTGQKIKMSGLDIFKRLDKIGLLQEGGSVGSAQSFGNTGGGLMNILPQIRQAMIMQYDQQRVRPALQQIGSALSQYSPQGGNQSSFGQNAFGSGQNAFNQQMQQQQQQVQRGSVGGVGKPTTLNTTQNFKQMPTLEDVYKGAVASGTFG